LSIIFLFKYDTVIRLPQSVFAPYTSITTNILFFDKTKKSEGVWFYRVDIPQGYKHFSKTKPMLLEHFADCVEWWYNRQEIKNADSETFKAKFYSVEELVGRNFDFDLCGYPSTEEEILTPQEIIQDFHQRRNALNAKIDLQLEKISALLQKI